MKKNVMVLLLALPLTLLAAEDIGITPQQAQALGIRTLPLASVAAVGSQRVPGEIVVPTGQERMVSAPQGGLITHLRVAAGQQVRRGQVLAQISSPDLLALQRDYLQGRTQQQLAQSLLERDQQLYRDGIIAERRLLSAQSAHAELALAQAQRRQTLKLAGMGEQTLTQLETRGELSSSLAVVAPMDGVVLEQAAAVGQRVEMNAPLYRIARLKPLWLEMRVPLEMLDAVRAGMAVSLPDAHAAGTIITILRRVNRDDQTLLVRAEIRQGVERLAPGQWVEAQIIAAPPQNPAGQYALPKSALVRHQGKTWIFVKTERGFRPVPIRHLREQSDGAVVSAALDPHAQVAVSGTVAIKAAWVGVAGE